MLFLKGTKVLPSASSYVFTLRPHLHDLLKFPFCFSLQCSAKFLAFASTLKYWFSPLTFFSMEHKISDIVAAWIVSQTLFFLFTSSSYLCLVKLFCQNDFSLKLELSQMLLIYGFSNCPSSWYQFIHHCRFGASCMRTAPVFSTCFLD